MTVIIVVGFAALCLALLVLCFAGMRRIFPGEQQRYRGTRRSRRGRRTWRDAYRWSKTIGTLPPAGRHRAPDVLVSA